MSAVALGPVSEEQTEHETTNVARNTGSTGVNVGADDMPNIAANAPAGSITYSSSGVELNGVWTPVTITFPDSKDEHAMWSRRWFRSSQSPSGSSIRAR